MTDAPARFVGIKTGAFEVIRGGEAHARVIALDRDNPGAVDERFLGMSVKDHSAF